MKVRFVDGPDFFWSNDRNIAHSCLIILFIKLPDCVNLRINLEILTDKIILVFP